MAHNSGVITGIGLEQQWFRVDLHGLSTTNDPRLRTQCFFCPLHDADELDRSSDRLAHHVAQRRTGSRLLQRPG